MKWNIFGKADTTSNAIPKKKLSKNNIITYGIIAVIISCFAIYTGAELDYCTVNGKIDFAKFGKTKISIKDIFHSLTHKGKAFVLLFMTLFSLCLYMLYKFTDDRNRFHRKGVEYGSAHWGDKNEKKSLIDAEPYKVVPLMKNNLFQFDEEGNVIGYQKDNNIIFSKDVKLSLDTNSHRLNLNSLVIGGSGAGKTRYFALPNIMQLNTSYVCTDPKGEILGATGKMLEQAGYKVRVLNMIDMEHSNNYNPFRYCMNTEGKFVPDNVLTLVEVLFSATKGDGEKQDFWQQKGKAMLQAIIFLLFEESVYDAKVYDENGKEILDSNDIPVIDETKRNWSNLNFFSVTEKMRRLKYPPKGNKNGDYFFMERDKDGELIQKDGETTEDYLKRKQNAFICDLDKDFIELEKRNPNALALRLYKEVRNAPEETGQSFLSSANVKTFVYNLDNVKNLTCTDNVHLETLGDEKTALFLILSATNGTYNFMSAMLYTQMFDTLSNRANIKYANNGHKLPVHVRCITDEFANIGLIPEFEKVIAFVRSMGISLNVIVQNQAQIKSLYEKTWEVITGNCDTTLFLGGKEESTLKSISESLGKETIDIKGYNRTKGKQSSTSENNQIIGRELMQSNEISTMPIDECIVMIRSHNPFYSKKYPLEEHPNYKMLTWGSESYDVTQIKSIKAKDLVDNKKTTEKISEMKKVPLVEPELHGENQIPQRVDENEEEKSAKLGTKNSETSKASIESAIFDVIKDDDDNFNSSDNELPFEDNVWNNPLTITLNKEQQKEVKLYEDTDTFTTDDSEEVNKEYFASEVQENKVDESELKPESVRADTQEDTTDFFIDDEDINAINDYD